MAPQNPVVVERLDGPVHALEIDLDAEEPRPLHVVPRHGVGEREANRQRVRRGDRKGRAEQREVRAPFGRYSPWTPRGRARECSGF